MLIVAAQPTSQVDAENKPIPGNDWAAAKFPELDLTMIQSTTMEIDPVCKMKLEPDQAAYDSEYDGTLYYFCSANCKQKFDADPTKYIGN